MWEQAPCGMGAERSPGQLHTLVLLLLLLSVLTCLQGGRRVPLPGVNHTLEADPGHESAGGCLALCGPPHQQRHMQEPAGHSVCVLMDAVLEGSSAAMQPVVHAELRLALRALHTVENSRHPHCSCPGQTVSAGALLLSCVSCSCTLCVYMLRVTWLLRSWAFATGEGSLRTMMTTAQHWWMGPLRRCWW